VVEEVALDDGPTNTNGVNMLSPKETDRHYPFQISTSVGTEPWILSAPSESERRMWIQQIEQAA
jgi:hypothetical protein